MIYYTCNYAKLRCLIVANDEYEDILDRFRREFSFYYDLHEANLGAERFDASIIIEKDAYSGVVSESEVCIHSSHSKNLKYLLDGTKYTQNDASIYAQCEKVDGLIKYYVKRTNSKLLVDINNRKVIISGNDLYNMLVYVYETILSINIEHNGGIQLHAACCEWNGKGYIITGKSGGGKTTLLFNILKNGGKFHSNDRVAIFDENGVIVAYSIPIPVNVPIDTMKKMPVWGKVELVANAESGSKIRFLVSELRQLFHSNMIATTNIKEIIIVNHNDEKIKVVNIKENIADSVEVLSPYDENHPKWIPFWDYPDSDDVHRKLDKISETLTIKKISGQDIFGAFKGMYNEYNKR